MPANEKAIKWTEKKVGRLQYGSPSPPGLTYSLFNGSLRPPLAFLSVRELLVSFGPIQSYSRNEREPYQYNRVRWVARPEKGARVWGTGMEREHGQLCVVRGPRRWACGRSNSRM